MKSFKKLTILIVILVLAAWSIIGCTSRESSIEKAISFSVTDMSGAEIDFEQTPETMVVLLPSNVEILYELGAQESIVAVGEHCDYPEEALKKEVISTGDNLNVEQIISLDPDVVIIGEMAQTTDQFTQLQDAGINVVITDSQSIASTYEAIDLMGQISGKKEEAEELINNMKSSFKKIQDKATGNFEKTIYFEVSPLEYGLWTTGKDTFIQELANILETRNVFEDLSGWVEISEEQVIERNPDYIVTSTMSYGDVLPVDEILGRENWKKVSAVEKQQVFNGNGDMMTRPGPRLVNAVQELYEFIYEE